MCDTTVVSFVVTVGENFVYEFLWVFVFTNVALRVACFFFKLSSFVQIGVALFLN
jgi:hypothetical protein